MALVVSGLFGLILDLAIGGAVSLGGEVTVGLSGSPLEGANQLLEVLDGQCRLPDVFFLEIAFPRDLVIESPCG